MKTVTFLVNLEVTEEADVDELRKDVEDAIDMYQGWCHSAGWLGRIADVLVPEAEA